MPYYMPIDGSLQEVNDNIFDAMVQALHQETAPPAKKGRINPDGSCNKRPLDEDYLKNNYQDNLTTPFTCPDCLQGHFIQIQPVQTPQKPNM